MVGDKKMNLSDFFNNPKVKAFKQMHGIEFSGEWEITSTENSQIFNDLNIPKGRIELGIENDIQTLVIIDFHLTFIWYRVNWVIALEKLKILRSK